MEDINKEHENMAKSMSWDTLADIIIDMEMDLYKMTPFLKKAELKELEETIAIYEREKRKRVVESVTYEGILFS